MPGAQFLLSYAVTPQRASGQEILILLHPPPVCSTISAPQHHQPRAAVGFAARHIPATARFRPSGALPRLPRRISDLRECSQGFPGTFPTFGSAPTTSPTHFQPLGVLPSLSQCISMLRERSRGFRECARRLTSALSARGAEIIQNHFIRRMNHGTDNSGKGERQGARDGA